ncbi:hypothetical protein H9W95_00290 [Flavobacterium lindanitolerans]|nr:hypothetical protein [Flavobacterium lindanitolerans]
MNTPISDFSATAVGGQIFFSDNNNGILLARSTTGSGSSAINTYTLYKTSNGGTSGILAQAIQLLTLIWLILKGPIFLLVMVKMKTIISLQDIATTTEQPGHKLTQGFKESLLHS